MAKLEWGQKRTCPTCAAKFYDLRQETIVCPVCKSAYDPEKLPKPRRGASVAREDKVPVAARRPTLASREPDDGGEEDDDVASVDIQDMGDDSEDDSDAEEGDLIEDASDLGEDDDDIGEVLEHVDEDDDKA